MLQFMYKGKMLNAKVDRPMELDSSFIHEDGLKRNLLKFYWEWIWSKHWASASPANHGWIFTRGLNYLVELFRHGPYLWGHVAFIWLVLQFIGTLAWAS